MEITKGNLKLMEQTGGGLFCQGRLEIHPLMNQLILKLVMSNLDLKTLKVLRCVCSLWKLTTDPLVQKMSKVSITWYGNTEEPTKPPLPTFMKYVEKVNPERIFFRNYKLMDWNFYSKEQEMMDFFLKCGTHIKKLALEGCYFMEPTFVRQIFWQWTPNMESLELHDVEFVEVPLYCTLEESESKRNGRPRIKYDDDDDDDDTDDWSSETETDSDDSNREGDAEIAGPMESMDIEVGIPNFNLHTFTLVSSQENPEFPLQWKEILHGYPNLKRLSLSGSDGDGDRILQLLKNCVELQKADPGALRMLDELDVFNDPEESGATGITNEHFLVALQLSVNLTSLRIAADAYADLTPSCVGEYIRKHSSSLVNLDLQTGFRTKFPMLPPPGAIVTYPVLSELRIQVECLATNNLEFLNGMPKLQKLILENINEEPTQPKLISNTIEIQQLETLTYLQLDLNILTVDCPRKIAAWFSKLKTFEAILDDHLLLSVYEHLTKLKELIVHANRVTDFGITGPSPPILSNIEPTTTLKEMITRKLGTEKAEGYSTGIGQMKELQRLSVKIYSSDGKYKDSVSLTDKAVYDGLIQLKDLRSMNLPRTTVTTRAFFDLCNQVNHLASIDHSWHQEVEERLEWSASDNRLSVMNRRTGSAFVVKEVVTD